MVQVRHIARLEYGSSLPAQDRLDGDVAVFGSNGPVGRHNSCNTGSPVVVVGRKGSHGKLQYSSDPVFAIDTTFFIDSTCTQTHIRWLYYALSTLELDKAGHDVGVPGLSREHAYSQRLPLPSDTKQRAIAAYLDTETNRIDTLITKKRRMIELLDEHDRRMLDDLFDRVRQNGLARLGYLAEVRSGLTLGGAKADSPSHVTLPYLRVANVKHDRLDLSEVKSVTVDASTARRTALRDGDVLMTEGGDIDKLGRGTVWRGEIDLCLHQNHVFAVRVRNENLLPEFLALLTRTSYARRYFEKTGVRSTNLASTNSSKVADFRIPFPSRTIQSHVVSVYRRNWETLERTRVAMGTQVDLLNERRQALITAAVTGELPVPGM